MLHRLLPVVRRRLALDHNPMRRRMDRYQTWLSALAVLVLLVVAPLVGARLAGARRADQQAQAHASPVHRVTAYVTKGPAHGRPGNSVAGSRTSRFARWTAPDGTPRHGVLSVPYASSGAHPVTIWTDAHGDLRPRPHTTEQMSANATVIGVFGGVGALAGGLAVVWAGHRLLDRRRFAAWDAQWAHIAPRWTRQY